MLIHQYVLFFTEKREVLKFSSVHLRMHYHQFFEGEDSLSLICATHRTKRHTVHVNQCLRKELMAERIKGLYYISVLTQSFYFCLKIRILVIFAFLQWVR